MTLGQIFFELRATQVENCKFLLSQGQNTLKILKIYTRKYTGAQLHMLSSILVRLHNSRSNTFLVTCDTSWKLEILNKSRAVTLKILKISTRKYTGAQLHMLSNILVRFHDSRSNTFFYYVRHKLKIGNFY
jgi:hypothetical protein